MLETYIESFTVVTNALGSAQRKVFFLTNMLPVTGYMLLCIV